MRHKTTTFNCSRTREKSSFNVHTMIENVNLDIKIYKSGQTVYNVLIIRFNYVFYALFSQSIS